jgi:hypothetical protein
MTALRSFKGIWVMYLYLMEFGEGWYAFYKARVIIDD